MTFVRSMMKCTCGSTAYVRDGWHCVNCNTHWPSARPIEMLPDQIAALKARNVELVEALETTVLWLEGWMPHTEHTDHIWGFIAKARAVLDKEGK